MNKYIKGGKFMSKSGIENVEITGQVSGEEGGEE